MNFACMVSRIFDRFFHAGSLNLLSSLKKFPCTHSRSIQNVHEGSTRVLRIIHAEYYKYVD